jgi:bifunctional ADP-heptose synthase (sugar kinase/adenylyltransferase)
MFTQSNGTAIEGNRLDFKNARETPASLTQALIELIREAAINADAIIALDQLTDANRGVITDTMRDELASIANERPALIMYVDSRAFIQKFRRMTIKCNDKEAARIVAPDSAGDGAFSADIVVKALKELGRQAGKPPFISCGANGVMCMHDGEAIVVPAMRHEGPIDICGAGDACSAGIVSALCAGADNKEAAFMGNLAAGVTVRKLAETGTANPREILAMYDEQFVDG